MGLNPPLYRDKYICSMNQIVKILENVYPSICTIMQLLPHHPANVQ